MQYFNGMWHHRGIEYATLHDALLSVWPSSAATNP